MSVNTDPVSTNNIIPGTATPKNTAPVNPWAFDDTPIYTLMNAMTAIARATNSLLGDQTKLIQGLMAFSSNLIGPESNNASNFWNAVLNNDETWIADSSGDPQKQSIYSNDMNINNTKASQTSTGYNNILSGLAQQTSSMTSNYGNLSQLANTVVTGLASAINQD